MFAFRMDEVGMNDIRYRTFHPSKNSDLKTFTELFGDI